MSTEGLEKPQHYWQLEVLPHVQGSTMPREDLSRPDLSCLVDLTALQRQEVKAKAEW